MKLVIVLIVLTAIVRHFTSGRTFGFGRLGGGTALGIGAGTGTESGWSAGGGQTYSAPEQPRDDYWAGSGAEIGHRETYERELPREPGDERY